MSAGLMRLPFCRFPACAPFGGGYRTWNAHVWEYRQPIHLQHVLQGG